MTSNPSAGQDTGLTTTNVERASLNVISAETVIGTAVENRQGETLGTIKSVMIDKVSGRVVYAVLSFGGFLGLGERYHYLPWSVLSYDPSQTAYVLDIDKDKLRAAPTFEREGDVDFNDPSTGRRVYDYYGVMPFWS